MKISIALCTYNGEKYLKEQLKSLLGQTRLPDELVICDDCSIDGTPDIISEFIRSAPFICRFEQNSVNLGYVKNFEKAISLTTGDIICCCDQDDIWNSNKLEAVESVLTDKNADYCFSNAETIGQNSEILKKDLFSVVSFPSKKQKKFNQGHQLSMILENGFIYGAAFSFKSGLKWLAAEIPDNWSHELWLATLASALGYKGYLIKDKLIRYRIHDLQTSGMNKNKFSYEFGSISSEEKGANILASLEKYRALSDRIKSANMQILPSPDTASHKLRKLSESEVSRVCSHYLRRKLMLRQGSKLRSLLLIAGETCNMNYVKYSKGWKSIAKDLLYLITA